MRNRASPRSAPATIIGIGEIDLARRSGVAAIEAMAASPWLALSAGIKVSKRRIWMVQGSLSSSHSRRARSILKPCGLPSGPA